MKIYVLSLIENKFYVGKSQNVLNRLNQHIDGSGSVWTTIYKPVDILEVLNENTPFDEDSKTLEYMKKYGIQNVRGGSFCEMRLTESLIGVIQKMINSANNVCFECGKNGHLLKNCPIKKPETTRRCVKFTPNQDQHDKTRIISTLSLSNTYNFEKEHAYMGGVNCFRVKFPGVFHAHERRDYSIYIFSDIVPTVRFSLQEYLDLSNLVWDISLGEYNETSYFQLASTQFSVYKQNPNTINPQIANNVIKYLREKGFGTNPPQFEGKLYYDSDNDMKSFINLKNVASLTFKDVVGIKFVFAQKGFYILI